MPISMFLYIDKINLSKLKYFMSYKNLCFNHISNNTNNGLKYFLCYVI